MSTKLTEFLAFLANPSRSADLEKFNSSDQDAREVMEGHGLTGPQEDALLAHDAAAIYRDLIAEGYSAWPFRIASGPTKGAAEADLLTIDPAGGLAFSVATPAGRGPKRPTPSRSKPARSPKKAKRPVKRSTSSSARPRAAKKMARKPKKR